LGLPEKDLELPEKDLELPEFLSLPFNSGSPEKIWDFLKKIWNFLKKIWNMRHRAESGGRPA
jgi:hypothetical protein